MGGRPETRPHRARAGTSSRSPSVSSTRAPSIHPSTWSGDRPPTIAPLTPGHASVHATATAATLVSCRSATGLSASRRFRLRVKAGSPNTCVPFVYV